MARVPSSVQSLPTGAERVDTSTLGRFPAASPPTASGGLDDISDISVPGVAGVIDAPLDIADLVEPKGSSQTQARQFARSANRSMISSSAVIPGAIAGGQSGAVLGAPFGPPGAIGGGVIGTIVGAGAGVLASDELADLGARFFPDFVSVPAEEVPQRFRVSAVAGEAFGGSILMGGQVLGIARTGATLGSGTVVNRLINQVLSSARTTPGLFAAAEGAGAVGATAGAAVAEAALPGNLGARTSAEVIGGFFAPLRTLTTGGQAILNRARNVTLAASNVMPEGLARRVPGAAAAQQQKARQVLVTYLKETGTDIGALRRAIRAKDIADLPLSVGQKTGDPAVIAMEVEFARSDETFRKALDRGGKEALSTIRDLVVLMRGTGDPQLIRQAAVLRDEALVMGLSARVDAARENALRSAGDISADTPEARETLSASLVKTMEDALKDSRTVERIVWDAVPREVTVDDAPLREAFESIQPELQGSAFDLPESVRQAITINLDELEEGFDSSQVTIGKVLSLRSRFLNAASDAASGSQPDREAARIYSVMADAALRTLDDPSLVSVNAGARDAIDSARAYSRALNDVFSRSFVGTTLQKTAGGGYRRAPESLLRHALATGQDATNRNMREIDGAMKFVASRGELVTARNAGVVRSEQEVLDDITLVQDAQERALRLAAAAAIDPTTGLPSRRGLQDFKSRYGSTLNRFPEVVEVVDDAIKNKLRLLELTGRAKQAEKLRDRGVLRKLTRSDNPVQALRTVLNGDFPQKHIKQLATLAKRSGPTETEGLTAALFEAATARATNSPTGQVDLTRLRSALAEPWKPGQPPLLDLMRENGLGTPEWHATVRKFLDRAVEIETAMKDSVAAAGILQDPDPTAELFLSFAGSGIGGFFSRLGGGTSLIAQGRGASYMRNTFSRLPMGRTRAFLTGVLRDSKKMDALLEVPDSQSRAVDLVRQVHGYILQAGLPPGDGVQEKQSGDSAAARLEFAR